MRSEAHFEILLNEQNKIICNAYIFYGADCALVYSQTYEGNNISVLIIKLWSTNGSVKPFVKLNIYINYI